MTPRDMHDRTPRRDDDPAGEPHGGERLGPAGVAFPHESEWLQLRLPADGPSIDARFVDRTMHALREDAEPFAPGQLGAFAIPEPAHDFVARTLAAIQNDRSEQGDQGNEWHDLFARHSAPEPSPEFVARTLDALRRDALPVAPPSATRWAWPLVAIAAGAAMWLAFGHRTATEPLELRLARSGSPAFSHAYAVTPLPAVLSLVARDDAPYALPDAVIDGPWIVLGGRR